MKFNMFAGGRGFSGVIFAIAMIGFGGRTFGVTDPTLTVGLTRMNQSVILNWTGLNTVPYQVQASANLTTWTNLGAVVAGTGAEIFFTNSISGAAPKYFRVNRVFPTPPGTASFNPATGLLTIVCNAANTVIGVSVDASSNIVVTSGASLMPISGGAPTTANTVLIQVLGSPGNDQITLGNGLPSAHIFGAEGNDTIIGGSGNDIIVGGPGNDTLSGGRGNDLIYADGGDTVVWNPGDGSDTIQGEGANNTLLFNGSNASENMTLSPNGSRAQLFRDVGNVTMDMTGIQTISINTLGGTDNVVINDMAGTDVQLVNVDLASPPGSGTGDGLADTVTVNGTAGADIYNIAANGNAVEVTGVGELVHVTGGELANDRIAVNGMGGDVVNVNGTAGADTMQITVSPVTNYARVVVSGFTIPVDVSGALSLSVNGLGGADTITGGNGLAALGIPITLDGGDGDDVIMGTDANDTIIGGPGNNTLSGGRGNDVIFTGPGTNTVVWNPGDGSDTVEGQGGSNTLQFNGSNVGENIDVSANGSRVRLFRDVGNVTMDLNGVQTINIAALGGADHLTVNTLAGTGMTQVNIDLGAFGGVGDGAADTVVVNGTASPDTINLTANAGVVSVTGLSAQVQISHPEVANDALTINGIAGIDTFNVGPGVMNLIGVILNQ